MFDLRIGCKASFDDISGIIVRIDPPNKSSSYPTAHLLKEDGGIYEQYASSIKLDPDDVKALMNAKSP